MSNSDRVTPRVQTHRLRKPEPAAHRVADDRRRLPEVAFRFVPGIVPPVRTRIGEVAEWPNAPVC